MKKKISFNKKFKKIIFFGFIDIIEDLIGINKKLNYKTLIITSSNQYKNFKSKKNIKIFDKINTSFENYLKEINKNEDTLFISLGSRLIFTKNIINNICKNNLVNFHASRLPFSRGGGGFTWRILQNDRIDNQIVHMVTENIDMGKILMYEKNLFPKSCTKPHEFEKFSNQKMISFYEKFLKNINNNFDFDLTNNTKYIGSYYTRINQFDNSYLDWNLKDLELINMINSFEDPYCGVTTFLNNKNIKVNIKKAQLHGGELTNHPYMAGIVIRHDNNWIVVSTSGKNCLIIEEVLDKNKKNILSKVKEGDRFFTPSNLLEKNFNKRIFYNSKGLKK